MRRLTYSWLDLVLLVLTILALIPFLVHLGEKILKALEPFE